VLNMCANNYLGLADHPALLAAAREACVSFAARRTFTKNSKPR
jgi:7-keto-8-aminopelargonate synthetase-like enzyme